MRITAGMVLAAWALCSAIAASAAPAELAPVEDAVNKFQTHMFGEAVALSEDGSTLVIGDSKALGYGAAYVYASDGQGGWAFQQRLVGEDGYFGHSVAISGNTILVGALYYSNDNDPPGVNRGAAYVFTRSGSTWQQEAKLVSSWGGSRFGSAVALRGDTAIIGAPGEYGGYFHQSGAAYVFGREAGHWTLQQRLAGNEGTDQNFGKSVALDQGIALVGALNSAYFFVQSNGAWLQEQELVGSDGFGEEAALSGDTAVIGVPAEGSHGGAAYVFTRGSAGWNQQQRLTPAGSHFQFAASVAVSGDTAVIGSGGGRAYVFVRNSDSWSQQQELSASPVYAGGSFGAAVAVSGTTAAVGAWNDTTLTTGSVFAYTRDAGSSWSQRQKITTADGAFGDAFGSAVDVSGDTLIVGASADATESSYTAGSATVFIRQAGEWVLQQKLTVSGTQALGRAVGVEGDTAIVGASGAAYVFVRSDGAWSQQQKLVPDSAQDSFGMDVALSGDTAVVGAPFENSKGVAYVFTRSGNTWGIQQKLVASDGAASDNFAWSVALQDNRALIGANLDDTAGGQNVGSIYAFGRTSGVWTQQQHVFAPDATPGAGFGGAIDLSDQAALIGASRDDGANTDAGAVYALAWTGSTWVVQQKLTPSPQTYNIKFGTAVALSGDRALIGADVETAFVFARSEGVWRELDRLSLDDGEIHEKFGQAVAIDGATACVGAPRRNTPVSVLSGSAHVYELLFDFGDAPDSPYPTRLASNGARHRLGTLQMGELVDAESSGLPDAGATGDDQTDVDDEDGLTFGLLPAGGEGSVEVVVTGGSGIVDAWIDLDGDGNWGESGEHILPAQPVDVGNNVLVFPVPAGAALGPTFARFRLSSAGVAGPTGVAHDGEVEDAAVSIYAEPPDPFAFNDRTDAATGTEYVSNAITISGIDTFTNVVVTQGRYSVNGGAYTSEAGVVNNGDTLRLRLYSSPDANSTTQATLTVGGVSDTFSVTTGATDTTAAPFTFLDETEVPPATIRTSKPILVSGVNAPSPISITGGTYRINGIGTFTSAPGTVNAGDSVRVRHTSSYEPLTSVHTTLNIGGMTDTFTSTTNYDDINPYSIDFGPTLRGQPQNTLVESATITPWGYYATAPIKPLAGTEYSINGGVFTATPGTIDPGSTLKVRHTTANAPDTVRKTGIKIGNVTGYFYTRTAR